MHRRIIVCTVTALFVLGIAAVWRLNYRSKTETKMITLGTTPVVLEVVRTHGDQEKGLSTRQGLAQNTGMVFAFSNAEQRSFWMKDMLFDIDIIWVEANGRIAGITYNAKPSSYPGTFSSPGAVKFVIEIPAGRAQDYRIKAGDYLDVTPIDG